MWIYPNAALTPQKLNVIFIVLSNHILVVNFSVCIWTTFLLSLYTMTANRSLTKCITVLGGRNTVIAVPARERIPCIDSGRGVQGCGWVAVSAPALWYEDQTTVIDCQWLASQTLQSWHRDSCLYQTGVTCITLKVRHLLGDVELRETNFSF